MPEEAKTVKAAVKPKAVKKEVIKEEVIEETTLEDGEFVEVAGEIEEELLPTDEQLAAIKEKYKGRLLYGTYHVDKYYITVGMNVPEYTALMKTFDEQKEKLGRNLSELESAPFVTKDRILWPLDYNELVDTNMILPGVLISLSERVFMASGFAQPEDEIL